jgi:hypothetical protein
VLIAIYNSPSGLYDNLRSGPYDQPMLRKGGELMERLGNAAMAAVLLIIAINRFVKAVEGL